MAYYKHFPSTKLSLYIIFIRNYIFAYKMYLYIGVYAMICMGQTLAYYGIICTTLHEYIAIMFRIISCNCIGTLRIRAYFVVVMETCHIRIEQLTTFYFHTFKGVNAHRGTFAAF